MESNTRIELRRILGCLAGKIQFESIQFLFNESLDLSGHDRSTINEYLSLVPYSTMTCMYLVVSLEAIPQSSFLGRVALV